MCISIHAGEVLQNQRSKVEWGVEVLVFAVFGTIHSLI